MAPLRGWGPCGQRLEASAPFGHWKTMTFIAALRYDRISAPWVIDGPINGELFTLYVEQGAVHFGASQKCRISETMATVPTPANHSATNHINRRASDRGVSSGISDSRVRA